MLNAKDVPSNSGPRPDPLDPGTYPARVVQVVGLGLQAQEYQGEERPPKNQLLVTYELLDEFMLDEDGEEIKDKPRWVSEDFSLNSLDSEKAKSTKRYYVLDPEAQHDGDWSKLVGTPCLVTLVQNVGKGKHKGKVFNNISSVNTMRSKEASKAPELVNPSVVFDPDQPDMEVWAKLPDWIKNRIKSGLEYEGNELASMVDEGGEAEEKEDW